MTTAPPRPSPKLESAVRDLRRALTQDDRRLFDDGRPRDAARLDDQYFHLWDHVKLMVLESMGKPRSERVLRRLERLSDQLAEAQARRVLPPRLIRKILPRGPHGTVHEK